MSSQDDSQNDRVDFSLPANQGILSHFSESGTLQRSLSIARDRRSCSPESVKDPYYRLGTHPELVERLWDELGGLLPVDCRWIVLGRPMLVNPASGVIFAFAGGTHTYAFRLPPGERAAALVAGAKTVHRYPAVPSIGQAESVFDLAVIGDEWVFGGWRPDEPDWCRAAFAFAG